MSNVKLAGNVSGTGSVTIASPNTNSDISISLPTVTGGSFIVSDSSGNVGIGTSSPSAKLHTYSATGATYNYVQTGDGNNAGIRLKNSVGEFYLLDNASGAFDIYDATAAASRLTITSSGNVGIGTSSPDFRLTLQSGGDVQMSFKDSGGTTRAYIGTAGAFGTAPTGALRIRSDQGGIVFGISGAETARLDTSGNFQFNSGYGSVATAYGCRAWVNFNGTGTVAIRASGNVSSLTDNGTGDYTINFTTAMPDANYSFNGMSERVSGSFEIVVNQSTTAPSTSALRVQTLRPTVGPTDSAIVCVSIFR